MLTMFLSILLAGPAALLAAPSTQDTPTPGTAPTERTGAGRMTTGQREAMWPAPTAEDWAKPVLITFQRTWEDALAVAEETGRPILVCTNMDGEIASEHYAGMRYRQPDIAKLYEPYVAVIASVYRHTPRDHDEEGRRIPCPRFGSVTCSEHIAIEPLLFDRFFDGQRVAPRHVMVELDGTEVYDVFYAFDTQSVFDRIGRGIAERPAPAPRTVRGDRSIVERVESRDIADRLAVEAAFDSGDSELRRALLERARELGSDAPLELLRRGLFGFDPDLAAIARSALAQAKSEDAVHLVTEVLSRPMPEAEREGLVSALERLGADSLRARTVASVQRGLAQRSYSMDVEAWNARIAGGPAHELDRQAAEARLSAPRMPDAEGLAGAAMQLDEAEAALALAAAPETSGDFAKLLLEDSHRAARAAKEQGATGWRVEALLARLENERSNPAAARTHAEAAMAHLPDVANDQTSMVVLAIFAHAREQGIRDALAENREWPKAWLADVHAAYDLLARHPHGLPAHIAAHHDFLRTLGALGEADRVLWAGLGRFLDAFELHERYCVRIAIEKGGEEIENEYTNLQAQHTDWVRSEWFRGYAALLTAEHHRRRWGAKSADEAYARSDIHFVNAVQREPEVKDSADHYAALALAGRARLALEGRDLESAVDLLIRAFERRPATANRPDGLNVTPGDTARMLRPRLRGEALAPLLARLEAALARLAEIDPRLLDLPDYERPTPR